MRTDDPHLWLDPQHEAIAETFRDWILHGTANVSYGRHYARPLNDHDERDAAVLQHDYSPKHAAPKETP